MRLFHNILATILLLTLFLRTAAGCMTVSAWYDRITRTINFLELYDNGTRYCYMDHKHWPYNNMRHEMKCLHPTWYGSLRDFGDGTWAVSVERHGEGFSFMLNAKCLDAKGKWDKPCRLTALTARNYCS